jgi:hypothetical protein
MPQLSTEFVEGSVIPLFAQRVGGILADGHGRRAEGVCGGERCGTVGRVCCVRERVMSSYVMYCRAQAAECARRAKLASSPELAAERRDLGQRWLRLAQKAKGDAPRPHAGRARGAGGAPLIPHPLLPALPLISHPSLPGLTRQSIVFAKMFWRRRWTRGSSPRVTLYGDQTTRQCDHGAAAMTASS